MRDDLKAAFRSFRHSPTFTAVALSVLALGIGAGTAIFSVVDAVILRALPFDESDRLGTVVEYDPTGKTVFGAGYATTQTYSDWRRLQESFEGLAAVSNSRWQLRTEGAEPADARGVRVTWEFFPVLRTQPLLGRTFTADDEVVGREKVVILSYGFWQRRFGGLPEVIGQTLDLSETPYEIVGVLPREFSYPVGSERPAEVFTPAAFRQEDIVRGGGRNYSWVVIGRLKDGISFAQASDNMFRIAEALDREHPKWGPGRRARVVPLQDHLVGEVRPWMLMLLAAVALVLLIACANVANLMLARATVRAREMGIRTALGATRWRLTRGLLVEGFLLSLTAAAIGLLIAYVGVQGIRAWLPSGLPRVASIEIDLRVLLAASAAAVASGVAFGIIPALQAARPDLTAALKDSGRSTTAGAGSQKLRGALVVAEVALAVILLVGAGLFIGSFARLTSIDPGFDYRNLLVLDVSPRVAGDQWEKIKEQSRVYVPQVTEAVRRLLGVVAVGTVSGGLPLTGSWSRSNVEIPGRGKLEGEYSLDVRTVSPEYLEVMRIPLLRGRGIHPSDTEKAERVVVLNEAAAQLYWPGDEAIGKRIKIGNDEATVVGLAGNIRHLGPEEPPRQEGYVAFAQNATYGSTLVIRTAGDPMAVLPAVKSAIWTVNPEQRLTSEIVTLEGYMDRLIAKRRFNMAILGLFGALGLVIAAVGIYGVMSYVVAQRTSEIGVRMALGATRGNVVGMVLGRATILMALGLVLGGIAAWFLSRYAEQFLFQTEPTDPRVFAAALIVLTFAGLTASALPARRAASVDPLIALRHE